MNSLWRRLRGCEEVTGNEILPCNALQSKLMYHNDLDERIMIDVVVLLFRSLLLYNNGNPLNVTAHKIWDVHHSHSGEVHQ